MVAVHRRTPRGPKRGLNSTTCEGDGHETEPVHGRADHRDFAGTRGRTRTADVCRKHGVSSATFYKWKAKYGGLEVSDAKRLKALEEENAKLKRLLAEAMLDNAMPLLRGDPRRWPSRRPCPHLRGEIPARTDPHPRKSNPGAADRDFGRRGSFGLAGRHPVERRWRSRLRCCLVHQLIGDATNDPSRARLLKFAAR